MSDYRMEYSKERGTWNIFNGAEWYAEGTYEQMEKMMDTIRDCELEEDYLEEAW